MLLQDKNIFVVEDNLQNRLIFQVILMRNGAQVTFERWGRDAISRLLSMTSVDLIVLDLMLGYGLSGYDVYDNIRSLPNFAHTPIVAVSASDASIAIPKTREKGFNGFIAKPIDDLLLPKQFAQIIDHEEVWYAGHNHVME